MVETQLCKLRHTSDTLIGRACARFQLKYGVCELHVRYGCWYSVFTGILSVVFVSDGIYVEPGLPGFVDETVSALLVVPPMQGVVLLRVHTMISLV